MLNNSFGKEVIIAQATERGDVYMDGPVEDEFDFSMEFDIVNYTMGSYKFIM